jgi:hypothetical protein
MLLQANAYLWSAASPAVDQRVAEPLQRTLSKEAYAPTVSFIPAADEPPRVPIEVPLNETSDSNEALIDVKGQVIANAADVDALLQTGTGEWVLTKIDGQLEIEPVAIVLEPGEGELKRAEQVEVQRAVRPVDVRFVSAGELVEQYGGNSGSTTTLLLLGLLGCLLAGEQFLAYASSYHPPTGASAAGAVIGAASRLSMGSKGAKR